MKRKRFLSCLVCAAMISSLLPANFAFAQAAEQKMYKEYSYSINLKENVDFSATPASDEESPQANKMLKQSLGLSLLSTEFSNWEEAGNAAVLDTDYSVDADGNYTVMTALGLAKIANMVNSEEDLFAGKTVTLNNDIDLLDGGVTGYAKDTVTAENSWNPIGTLSYDVSADQVTVVPFLGVFDGNGYSVKNLYMNYPDVFAKNTGLFGSTLSDFTIGGQCTIKNVTIEGAKIKAGFPVSNSFIVGMAADTAISGCTVDKTSEMEVLSDYVQLNGGIAGGAQESGLDLGGDTLIENCTNNGTISGGFSTGGIVGGTGQIIVGCTNNGNITASDIVGGIVGLYSEDNAKAPFEILNCKNTGNITTKGSMAGGIAGEIYTTNGMIANCYNSGTVSAGGDAGGIGGTVEKGKIQNCYNTGEIKGTGNSNNLGGIVGRQYESGSVENCYSSGTVSGGNADTTGTLIGLNKGTVKGLYYPQGTTAVGTTSTGTAEQVIDFNASNTLSSEVTIGNKTTTNLTEALNYYLDYVLMDEVYYSWKDTETTPVLDKAWTEPPKEVGPFIVSGGTENQDYKYTTTLDKYNVNDNVLTVLTDKPLSITANSKVTTARIAVADGVNADITLNNLKIDLENKNGSALAIPSGSSLKLTVKGDNLLRSYAAGPGILVDNGAELEINGTNTDSLEVYGSQMYSYSNQGDISGGIATGFAGIGGQNSGSAYTYTGKITINGGTITAHGYGYGAGIGGGDFGSGGTITINGGIITATTGEGLPNGWINSSTANASGIGASQGQAGGTILITGGTVKATGGYACAGIGGGTADVTITGGDVTAYGGPYAAGIGGYNQNKGNIKITIGADATVTAYGGTGGCGLGQGSNKTAPTTLNIEKGAKVIAFSKESSNRPAITAVTNGATNPANMINAYITNMTLPLDVPITAVLGNETVNMTVPAGVGGVAFTTDAAGEFVAKTSVAVGGITYQFIPVDSSKATVTSGKTFAKEDVKAVSAADIVKETTPNAYVDYENGRLSGITANADYRLSYEGAPDGYYLDLTADDEGNLTHQMFEQFYGKNVSVIKLGNGGTILNSDPQWIFIKQLQAALSIESVPEKVYGDEPFELSVTGGSGTGILTYDVSNGENIQVSANGLVRILGVGESTITVTKAEDENYVSVSQNVVIKVNPRPVNVVWNGTENLVYDGTEKAISASVGNIVTGDTANLTLAGDVKATEKGSYTATVTAVDNHNYTLEGGTNLEKTWSISGKELTADNITTIADTTYTGEEIKPVLEIKDGDTVLTLDTDYTVEYHNNINATGETKAKAVVTFIGNYTGTADKEFVILPKTINNAIPLTAPVKNAAPQTSIETDEYTATVVWSPKVKGNFAYSTVYTATVTITPKANYTTAGIAENSYTFDGAETVVNSADAGEITVTYPATGRRSGGGGSSNTTTTTTKNEDGSTTKTTTNKATGTTTEVTTKPDGSTTTVETKKDGTVTTTEKDKDGNTTTTVENTDGTSVTTEKTTDGTTTVTEKAADGTTTTTETDKAGNKTVTTENADGSTVTEETRKDGTTVKTETTKDGETTADITVPGNKETTVEIPVENADEVTKVVAADKDGNETEVEFEVKDSSVVITVSEDCTVSLMTGHICHTDNFSDTDVNAWYHENVDYVLENGLMNGTATDKFAPNDNLTRAMLVTILYRAEGEPATNKSIPFNDVDMGSYYANAVIWGQQNGIINGYTETEFAPNDNITREQIAAILYRYAIYKSMDAVNLAENLGFADADSISEYAISALNWAVGAGLIKGYENNTVRPQNFATRAEAAAILQRFIEANK